MSYKTYEVRVYENGTRMWYLNGKLHREDGPAVECAGGTRKWFLNGNLHREDGPAIEWANGTRKWWVNGKRHREDGPAVVYAGGHREWWVNGVKLTEEEHARRTQPVQELTVAEISERLGYEIKVVK